MKSPGATVSEIVALARTTCAVAVESDAAEPAEFVAVTVTLRKLPTSAVASTYVELIAPAISEYVPPSVADLLH
jgi:hypothetical protein